MWGFNTPKQTIGANVDNPKLQKTWQENRHHLDEGHELKQTFPLSRKLFIFLKGDQAKQVIKLLFLIH